MQHIQRVASIVLLSVFLLAAGCTSVRQLPNHDLEPSIPSPTWPEGGGPRVVVDHGHGNFHTIDKRYLTFATLLRRDGFVVEAAPKVWTADGLADADILVISNPLAERNLRKWRLPTPSAFTEAEIAAVRAWVEAGGALFLIADHMPFPGAASELAEAFGVYFHNGFATDAEGGFGRQTFTREAGLVAHPILDGRDEAERVDTVSTFTGQAFRVAEGVDAAPLLVLPEGSEVVLSPVAWKFSERTPRIPAAGLWQGGVLRIGAGRAAIFGEAAMFTAQRFVRFKRGKEIDSTPMGMGSEGAEQNPQFLLNLMHWLAGVLPAD